MSLDAKLVVNFGGVTRAGVKPQNEDAFAALSPSSSSALTNKGVVACLADGVSCSDRAQLASQTSVTQFVEDYYSTPDSWSTKKSAGKVLTSLNAWLFHHGQQGDVRSNGLVTTFSAVVIKSTTAHVFHVGDSRIYLVRDGEAEQITRDHCQRQGEDKSYLTRALGMDSHLEVDYHQVPVQQGDVLMLTTDGVHEFLSRSQARDIMLKRRQDLEGAAEELVTQAETNGSDDNLSCLMVEVVSLPVASVDEVHRELTELAIPPVMDVGNKIDHFEILDILHSGTRSHLYLVRDLSADQVCVLKAPSQNFADDPQYLEGFIREEWVGRRIDSPSVMKIYPRPSESRFLYHICQHIKGQTLRQWMYDHPKPSLQEVRRLLDAISRGIRVFQRMGMVHRDLKPENILIDSTGVPVILDFGTVKVEGLQEISRGLGEEVPVGSVDYVAPESLRGEGESHQTDIFALGVIAYEMLTGKVPCKTTAEQQRNPQRFQGYRYRSVREERPDLPVWVDLALARACEESPLKRYSAMTEFLQDLSTPNKQLLSDHLEAPLMKRNPVLFWQVMAFLLLVVALVEAWLLATVA